MRLATSFVLLSIVSLTSLLTPEENNEQRMMMTDAAAAAVATPSRATVEDHYGDPDNFIKYIIKKPQVFS